MRWWSELQMLGVARLALASRGLRGVVVMMTVAVPCAIHWQWWLGDQLAQRQALQADTQQLSQQWQAAEQRLREQQAITAVADGDRSAALHRWHQSLGDMEWTVVEATVTADRLSARLETDWHAWLGGLEALNGQSNVAVRVLNLGMWANGDAANSLNIEVTLTAVAGPDIEHGQWGEGLTSRDPFVMPVVTSVPVTPQDPLAQHPLDQLTIAGVMRHRGDWQVLIQVPNGPLHRRGLGAVLGHDGGVITTINRRQVVLHANDESRPSRIELPVRRSELRTSVMTWDRR